MVAKWACIACGAFLAMNSWQTSALAGSESFTLDPTSTMNKAPRLAEIDFSEPAYLAATSPTPAPTTSPGGQAISTHHFFVELGTGLIGPYKIKSNTAAGATSKTYVVDTGQQTGTGFIGVNFHDRWAWNQSNTYSAPFNETQSLYTDDNIVYSGDGSPGPTSGGILLGLFPVGEGPKKEKKFMLRELVDWTCRFDMAFAGQEASAATIIGSGDAFGETTAAYHLYQAYYPSFRESFDLEVHYSFATLRDFADIHEDYGIGVASAWGMPITINDRVRFIELVFGMGYSWLDSFDVIPVGQNNQVEVRDNLPRFKLKNAFYYTATANIPFGETSYVSIGGRFNDVHNSRFDSWSIILSYTATFDSLEQAVGALAGNNKK